MALCLFQTLHSTAKPTPSDVNKIQDTFERMRTWEMLTASQDEDKKCGELEADVKLMICGPRPQNEWEVAAILGNYRREHKAYFDSNGQTGSKIPEKKVQQGEFLRLILIGLPVPTCRDLSAYRFTQFDIDR